MKKSDLKKYYNEIRPEVFVSQTIDQLFNLFDRDRNGKVDFIEFYVLSNDILSGDVKKKLQIAFKLIDKENNGIVSKIELKEALLPYVGMEIELKSENDVNNMITDMFRSFGKDQNETLSEEEFVNGCLNDEHFLKIFSS